MRTNILFILILNLFFSFSLNTKAQFVNTDICGYWNTGNKESVIKIFNDTEGKIWGEIVKLKNEIETDKSSSNYGKPKFDKYTMKPIIGTRILLGLVFNGDDCWENGKVYDPEKGKRYDCSIKLSKDKNTLKLTGYLGAKFLGKTVNWTRITG